MSYLEREQSDCANEGDNYPCNVGLALLNVDRGLQVAERHADQVRWSGGV